MIKIRIAQPKDGYMGATYVSCPHCGKVTSFYSISPPMCQHCNISFPNIRSLKQKTEFRFMWHKGV